MNRNTLVGLALIVATAGMTGCDAVTGTAGGSPVGVGGISAGRKGTAYTTMPQLAFYRVASATFISAAGVKDTCFNTTYSSTTSGGQSTASAVNAGAFVSLRLGTRTDTLTRTGGTLDATYRSTLAAGIPFTPGDSLVVTIPGDRTGFPASTFRGKTAEPFTMGQLVIPPTGSPINVTWTPASDLNAAMYVTFRYTSSTSTATAFNRQIACSFVDDGTGTISAAIAADWIASSNHDMIAQRIRTILTQIDVPLSYFNFVSAFDWPTPITP